MSWTRLLAVFHLELARNLKRPMFWTMMIVLILIVFGLSNGNTRISSGSATVGGDEAWITSEFSVALILPFLVTLYIAFFASIAAGLAIISDSEAKIGEILRATRLRPWEYIWGKGLAIVTAFSFALALTIALMIFFNHGLPNPSVEDFRGPFQLSNYLRPALVFGLPSLLAFLGIPFYLGERTRRPAVSFLFPVGLLLVCGFFLWNWSPTWLDPKIDRLLMLLDPAGVRWLDGTWLKQDLGVGFYNHARVGLDLPFILSRLAWSLLGLCAISLTSRNYARGLRSAQGKEASPSSWFRRRRKETKASSPPRLASRGSSRGQVASLPNLLASMTSAPPGVLRGALQVARSEFGLLLKQPGIYLFSVLIVVQTLGTNLLAVGPFQTQVLLTPGQQATQSLNTLTLLTTLLLMFFTAESLQREKACGAEPLIYSSPLRTFSLLAGKAMGNSLVGLLPLVAVWIGGAIALLLQGSVPLSLGPYFLIWGLLLLPTLLAWTAFVVAIQAVTSSRFATYGICLGVLGFTIYHQLTGNLDWLSNWMVWGSVSWSDMSVLEVDRKALMTNRLLVLSTVPLFLALAVGAFSRRRFDAANTLEGLRPRPLARTIWRFLPWAAAPLALGFALSLMIERGVEGQAAKNQAKDYWKQNLATWRDAENPDLLAVDVSVVLDLPTSSLSSQGTYRLVNSRPEEMRRFALTGGQHWQDVSWTLDGSPYEPDNRSGLYVFTPPLPLAPGEETTVGFQFHGAYPDGASANGGQVSEFILPSGVVLTSFTTSFVPALGYQEGRGVDEDNRYEPREYPDDFYQEEIPPFAGSRTPFTTRVSITGPLDFTMNSVGELQEEKLSEDTRTTIWVNDVPVRFFNIVGGRWEVEEGETTSIFYHPQHPYNVAQMSEVAEAAKRLYSEWFYPYPWQHLKISEFPALATYAQGFATNIPFSEGIGFLTRPDEKTDAVTVVTGHEIAHQWWANILTPGEGPGGNLLSEGMSHFATLLLLEELQGPRGRMEFAKRMEENYGDRRQKDAERPLVKIDGSRPGDTTVTYDKGGWVFWMTLRQLGREAMLEGLQGFIEEWKDGPDYPLLEDLTEFLLPYANDPVAYEEFVRQWYFQVVLPEFQLQDVSREPSGSGYRTTARLHQAGSGKVRVEVAATAGERFLEDGTPNESYQETRAHFDLVAGEESPIDIFTEFEPDRLVVDPDVQILQLRREQASADL
ncbi:MAG: hypothetical protein K0U98_23955 [Deltaproteobacteria bacterium]|nr:hypothetical protein [Deltaproteobacteria bacterium]